MDTATSTLDLLARHASWMERLGRLSHDTMALVHASRARVLASRRVLGEVFTIQGGGWTAADLRERIRDGLAAGTLPMLTGRAWAGPSTGKTCLVCREKIVRPSIEYEIQDPANAYAHLACYTLWLEESTALRTGTAMPRPRPGAPVLRILVVDAERDRAVELAALLGQHGHRVAIADDGAAAIRELERDPFDLVMSGIVMPVLDGRDLFLEIKRRWPGLAPRFVWMGGESEREVRAAAFIRASGTPFLRKPLTFANVLTTLESVTRQAGGGPPA